MERVKRVARTAPWIGAVTIVGLMSMSGKAVASDFCGRPTAEPDALLAAVTTAGMRKIFEGPEYHAYQDPASEAVYTFTYQGVGPAHPAAVCRKPVRTGGDLTLQMVVVCRGAVDACQRLESEFKKLNAQMEAHIRGQAGVAAGQPR
jgi:hypothetical protein